MLTYGGIILAITSFTFHKTSAVCCGWNKWHTLAYYGMNSVNDRYHEYTPYGYYICGDHPGYCCGVWSCNIFCCNCGRGICQKYREVRSVGNETEEYSGAEKLFEIVDENRDNNVTMVEAGRYFQKQKYFKRTINFQIELEFKKIDVNNDGIISPAEFDESLKEKK